MTPYPLVTVVIPCFNQSMYLSTALASVHGQDWPAIESIVIDDGSTDDTSEVAARLGATMVRRQVNQGLSQARNAGLALAHGEFVLFLDADDELLPEAVRTGVEALRRNPGAGCVARRCLLMDHDGRPLPVTHPLLSTSDLYRELLLMNFVWTPGAVVFRRSAVNEIGGFPSDHPAASDYAVLLTFARRGCLIVDARDVIRYRKHESNMSRNAVLMLSATLATLERERRHLPAQYRISLAEGRRRWREFYGEQLTEQLRREWRGARRSAFLVQGAMFLLRRCPRLAMMHARRKLTVAVRRMASTALGPSHVGPSAGQP